MGDYASRIILGVVALTVGVGGGVVMNYTNSFKKLSVALSSGEKVSIYKDLGGDGAYNYSPGSPPLFSLASTATIKLREGTYDAVVADPDHQYADPVSRFQVVAGNNSVAINPTFTDQKLASLLPSERPAITQALDAKYPIIPSLYTITQDRLYERGDWYGAVLTPSNPQDDVMRVILHQESGTWVVATDPPKISIGEPSNPTIPTDVIESLDQL